MTKKTIFPTVMQAKVVNIPKDKRVTIISTGYGSGRSVALLFKAINSKCDVCTIIHPSYQSAKLAFHNAAKFLAPLGFRHSINSMILSHSKLNIKIKFCDDNLESTSGISRELIMFDRPEHCNRKTLIHHSYRAKELVFASSPAECLHIKYKEIPYVDELGVSFIDKGEIVTEMVVDEDNSTWCLPFVDFIPLQDTFVTEGMFYHSIHLVTGCGVEDNPHLMHSDSELMDRTNIINSMLGDELEVKSV